MLKQFFSKIKEVFKVAMSRLTMDFYDYCDEILTWDPSEECNKR